MKVLSRDFTTKEKVLILILVLLLIGLAYYQFVYKPMSESLENAAAEKVALEDELVVLQAKVAGMKKMQQEMDELESSERLSVMPSYNASKEEVAFLNNVFNEYASSFSVDFSNVTREGDQIRRAVKAKFTVDSYEKLEQIVTALAESENRCLVGDVRCSRVTNRRVVDGVESYTTNYSADLSAVFFETMVGGTPDAGLPSSDRAAQ